MLPGSTGDKLWILGKWLDPSSLFPHPEMARLVHHSDNICGGKVYCLVGTYFLDSTIRVYESCIDVLKRQMYIYDFGKNLQAL